ncbi:hypothetical protein GJ496_010689, partial [Pomphorhynchus laevis]
MLSCAGKSRSEVSVCHWPLDRKSGIFKTFSVDKICLELLTMGAAVNTDVSNNEKYTNDIKLDKSKTKNSFKNKIQRIFDIVKKKFRLHKKKSTKNSIKKCESSNASQTKIFPEVCEISSWSESLSNILSSPFGRQLFMSYLKTEYCEENLEFWIECKEYLNIPVEFRQSAAKYIYHTYIATGADKQ